VEWLKFCWVSGLRVGKRMGVSDEAYVSLNACSVSTLKPQLHLMYAIANAHNYRPTFWFVALDTQVSPPTMKPF
jgi:hypothetical protein